MNNAEITEAQKSGSRIAARANIREVRLLGSSVELAKLPSPSRQLRYKVEKETEVEYNDGDNSFVVVAGYNVVIDDVEIGQDSEEAEPAEDHIADINFRIAGLFTLEMRDGDDPPKSEELTAYAFSTGNFALHPYAREYIYNVTGRLALPPLTIGVLQLDFPNDAR